MAVAPSPGCSTLAEIRERPRPPWRPSTTATRTCSTTSWTRRAAGADPDLGRPVADLPAPRGPCFDAQFAVMCIAGRIEPDPGIDNPRPAADLRHRPAARRRLQLADDHLERAAPDLDGRHRATSAPASSTGSASASKEHPWPNPLPLILDNAGLKIGDGAATEVLTELACLLNHIELTPDVTITTLTTMCGERDYPGVVKWSLIATLYQSFDPDATEEVLSAAVEADGPVAVRDRRLPRPGRLGDQPDVVGRGHPAALRADQRGRRRRLDGRARVVGRRRAGQEHHAGLMAKAAGRGRASRAATELLVGSRRLIKQIDAAARRRFLSRGRPDGRACPRPGPATHRAARRVDQAPNHRPVGAAADGRAASPTRAGSSSAAAAAGRSSSAAATCTRPPWTHQPMAVLAARYAADNEIRGFSWPRVR